MGRTTRKDIYHHSQKLEPCRREIGRSSGTSEGSKPTGSPVAPTEGPHIFTISRHVSKPKPEFGHYNLLVGHCYYLLKRMGRDKIIYFLWIQSEYNLSSMLSKHWELLKILQVIQKLLILYDLIPLISRSATKGRTRKSDRRRPMSSK